MDGKAQMRGAPHPTTATSRRLPTDLPFQALLDAAPDTIVIVDTAGRIVAEGRHRADLAIGKDARELALVGRPDLRHSQRGAHLGQVGAMSAGSTNMIISRSATAITTLAISWPGRCSLAATAWAV